MHKRIPASINCKSYVLDRVMISGSGCWEWQNSVNPKTGYGQIGYYPYTAHRLAYFLWNGEPVGQVIRHSCHNKRCCNPEHLQEGSHADNWYDSEDAHREAGRQRRGRTPSNARSVTIGGVSYSSVTEAMRSLRLGHKAVMQMLTERPRRDSNGHGSSRPDR